MAERFPTILAGMFILAGIGIFGWQVLLFLSDGAWVSFSLIDLGKVFGYDWFFSPGSWLGLHWLLNKVPTALLLILFGYWILLAGDNVR